MLSRLGKIWMMEMEGKEEGTAMTDTGRRAGEGVGLVEFK